MIIPGEVLRRRSTTLGTPGRMALSNGFAADTLELGWHNNERGISCTYADVYRGRVWFSPDLRRPVIRLEDKHGRFDCLVHNGNWAADAVDVDGDGVPEVTQVHGCTEVGSGYGDILRKDGRTQWGIRASGKMLDLLIASLRDAEVAEPTVGLAGYISGYHEVLLTYRWAEGCAPDGYVAPREV